METSCLRSTLLCQQLPSGCRAEAATPALCLWARAGQDTQCWPRSTVCPAGQSIPAPCRSALCRGVGGAGRGGLLHGASASSTPHLPICSWLQPHFLFPPQLTGLLWVKERWKEHVWTRCPSAFTSWNCVCWSASSTFISLAAGFHKERRESFLEN